MLHGKCWLSVAVAVPLILPYPALGADVKTAEECIAKYIEAIGGQKKIDAVKTARIKAKSVMSQSGMEIPMTFEYKKPDKVRMEITFQGMTMVQAVDGKKGWFIQPFSGKTDPEPMSSEMLEAMEEQRDLFGPLVHYKEKGYKVDFLGKDELEGSPVYKLKVTKKSGATEVYFLDADAFIPIKVKSKRTVRGTPFEGEVTFGNYKKVDGILMPHSMQQSGGGNPMGPTSIVFEKIEFNVDIPNERFAMPKVEPKSETGKAATPPPGGSRR